MCLVNSWEKNKLQNTKEFCSFYLQTKFLKRNLKELKQFDIY